MNSYSKMLIIITMTTFCLCSIRDILGESGRFGLYFEKYVVELDKLLTITFLVCLCNVRARYASCHSLLLVLGPSALGKGKNYL